MTFPNDGVLAVIHNISIGVGGGGGDLKGRNFIYYIFPLFPMKSLLPALSGTIGCTENIA